MIFPTPPRWICYRSKTAINEIGNATSESTIQKAVSEAARRANINKHVTPHTSQSGHSFATHLLQNGYDTQHLRFWAGVRTVQPALAAGQGNSSATKLALSEVEGTSKPP